MSLALIPYAGRELPASYRELRFEMECVRLFKRRLRTDEIAFRLAGTLQWHGTTEAKVYNALHHARERGRG